MWTGIVLDDDAVAAGEGFAATIVGFQDAWQQLNKVWAALDPALRAELEAGE